MYNVTGLNRSRSRYQKKKSVNFEEFIQPPKHTFLCPTYFALRNLLNLTNRHLHRPRIPLLVLVF